MKNKIIKLLSLVTSVCLLTCSCGQLAATAGTTDSTTAFATTSPSSTSGTTVTSGTTGTTAGTTLVTTRPLPNTPLVDEYDGTLTDAELRDKILGGWIGQMAGVAFFAKSEFGWSGQIMTSERVDKLYAEWENGTVGINDAFDQLGNDQKQNKRGSASLVF